MVVMKSSEYRHAGKPNLRPVNVLRDMPVILDLIEMGFENELDPQGWKMLKQMRDLTRQAGMLRMRSALRSESGGFVWEEDGNVVANLSLRIALPSVTRGRLIGNVVVHHNYRGQGIGHALLDAAIDAARREGARWIGLEVRKHNTVAVELYQQFGFRTVGTIFHLLRRSNMTWPCDVKPLLPWRKSKPQDKGRWMTLVDSVYGHNQKRVLEIRDYQFAYGSLNRSMHLWFNAQRESAWVNNHTNSRFAVCVKTDHRFRFHVWNMLMHADEDDAGARELVTKAFSVTRHSPPWSVIALVADQRPLVDAMQHAGFHIHRRLLQMILEL
jgi:GNAT superfamily N-acetyltransferase